MAATPHTPRRTKAGLSFKRRLGRGRESLGGKSGDEICDGPANPFYSNARGKSTFYAAARSAPPCAGLVERRAALLHCRPEPPMHGLNLHPAAPEAADTAREIERLETALSERKAELTRLQEGLRDFKARYAHVCGGPLAELAELERAIRAAEEQRLGIEVDDETADELPASDAPPAGATLRRLFWSVAKLFHPDHASDEGEAGRRHAIMAEASRAYREGDADSLNTLLGDEELRFYCATARGETDDEPDAATRLFNLKEELRTVEFGIKRVLQDSLYQLKLRAEEEAASGRDTLAETAERTRRQIAKARRRLEHLS